jgi:hypothetical protein
MDDERPERRNDWQIQTALSDLYRNYREIRRILLSLDHIVNGNPEKHDPGFDARIEKCEDSLRRVNNTLWSDPSGSKGLVAEFIKLKESREDRRLSRSNLTTIIVSIIGTLAFVLPNLDKIKDLFHEKEPTYEPDAKLKAAIKRDKERHRKKKLVQLQASTTIQ